MRIIPSIFTGKVEFNDDEFSDNDIHLLEIISDFAKDKSATDLIKYTHRPNSLWRKSAIRYGILELLEDELLNTTGHNIDFSLIFENQPELLEQFEEVKENLEFVRCLKS